MAGLLLLWFARAIGSPAPVPDSGFLIDAWTAENGLPDSSVTSIAQTPDGYLWAGTYNGLVRFDGVRFVTFDPSNTPQLRHARIQKLGVDARGTLWISTYDGSLTAWRAGKFSLEWSGDGSESGITLIGIQFGHVILMRHAGVLLTRDLNAPPGQAWQEIRPDSRRTGAMCCEDSDGNVWYQGRSEKLWRFSGGYLSLLPGDSGLANQHVLCLATDERGKLWAGTDHGLFAWNGRRFEDMTPRNSAPKPIRFICSTDDGGMWCFAGDRVRKAKDRQWIAEAEPLRGVFAGNLDRTGARQDHRGGVWIYDYGRGLTHVSADGHVLRFGDAEGFPGDRVDCFFEDREGNWWAGLNRAGLVRVRHRRIAALSADNGNSAALTVCEDASHGVWIGTLGGGLDCWKNGAWSHLDLPGGTSQGFVFSVCPDPAGRLWISAGNEDLFVREPGGNAELVQPAVHGVKSILADRSGRVWVGTKSGLYLADDARKRNFRLVAGFPREDVRALAECSGAIWAGTGRGSLYRIEEGNVTEFRPNDRPGADAIWSLLADADGTIWAGTFRGGLLRFRDGKFTRYDKPDGLPGNVICQILADDSGNLWIGTHQGILRVALSALNAFADHKIKSVPCTMYGRYDGLPSVECSGGYQPAAWRGPDGQLYFTTLNGVARIHPDELHPNLLPPPVCLESVLVDGKQQPFARGTNRTEMIKTNAPVLYAPLTVSPGKRQFEFHFTGLSFVSPDKVRFRYRLEGVDPDWSEASPRRSAQYSYLRPGNYRFRVIACNADGVWNQAGLALPLKVLPHFYETWWFLTLTVLMTLGSVAGTARYAVSRKLRREMAQLEQQRAVERDRARIAKDIHDDLGAGLTQITLLSELARRDPPEEIQEHLDQISHAARELTRDMDEIVWAVDPQNDTLDGLITYVCKFAQEYLNVAGIRCRWDLPEQLPACFLPAEVRHNLFLAVREALNNVAKHSGATEVQIGLLVSDDAFTLAIHDDGCGFGGPGSGSRNGGPRVLSGHGVGNLEKRLASIGGQCVISGEPDQGARVEFTVPFGRMTVERDDNHG